MIKLGMIANVFQLCGSFQKQTGQTTPNVCLQTRLAFRHLISFPTPVTTPKINPLNKPISALTTISLILVFIMITVSPLTWANKNWETSETFQSFSALLNSWQSMQNDYQQQAKNLSETEAQEYQNYLTKLQLTLTEQCKQLSTDYPEFPALQFGCQPVVKLSEQQLKKQRLVQLQQEFFDDLSKIDELLLQEQQKLEQQQNGSINSGESNEDNQDQSQQPQNTPNDNPKNSQQQQQDNQQAYGSKSHIPSVSKDRPPGTQDDDIVARQLREAAEKETSPELKRKLWDEYERYQSSI